MVAQHVLAHARALWASFDTRTPANQPSLSQPSPPFKQTTGRGVANGRRRTKRAEDPLIRPDAHKGATQHTEDTGLSEFAPYHRACLSGPPTSNSTELSNSATK